MRVLALLERVLLRRDTEPNTDWRAEAQHYAEALAAKAQELDHKVEKLKNMRGIK